ncbi:MAG TPA: DNA modification methylase [Candidatus Paceibacterota bacterium]|nr:DNA modification methylase [Candidatus Paceibacterota bacterium]
MKKLSWTTGVREVKDLLPWQENPRKISEQALDKLKEKITQNGFHSVIVIDTDNTILSGNQRKTALMELGINTVDVMIPSRKLSDAERRRIGIESNINDGEWDFEKLKSFDLELLQFAGFDEKELVKFWDDEKDTKDDKFDIDKELKKIKTPQTKLGDLIIMGNHKLLCSSSTNITAVKKLFGDDRATAIYSDPPFNIGLSYDKGVGNKSNYGGSFNDNQSPEAYKEFIRQVLKSSLAISTKDTHVAFWCDEAWVWVFQTLYMELGVKNRRLNIWIKNNSSPIPTVAFNKCAEYCVYGTKGSPYLSDLVKNLNEIQNKDCTTGNQLLDDISNIWATKRLPSNQMEHPTSKNPELHHKFIMRCTKPGDIIFDAFSGSASTMICAEQLDRKVYSLEIEPVFCDLAIRRYEKLTGRKAQVIKKFYEKE